MSATLIEAADEHHWVLLDHTLSEIVLEVSSLRLQTWSLDASSHIRIAAPFRLTHGTGHERLLDPSATETLSPILSLLKRRVESLTISRAGDLMVALTGGTSITVPPLPRGVAWELVGGGALEGLSYHAVPGGGCPWQQS